MFIETFHRIFVLFNIKYVSYNLVDILELVLWLLKCLQIVKEMAGIRFIPNQTNLELKFHYGSHQNSIIDDHDRTHNRSFHFKIILN